MTFNIPCRSNPMPHYIKSFSMSDIPLTFQPISSNTSITLNKYSSSSLNKTFKYSKNGGEWTTYSFGTTIPLNVGDKIAFSGDSTAFHPTELDQTNNFIFNGSANGYLKAYGNVHSLMNYSTLTTRCFRNLFRQQQFISDYSGIWLPLPESGNGISGLYGSSWRGDSYVQKLPILRNTDWTYLLDETFNATGYRSSSLSCVEVCWPSWPSTGGNNSYFLYSVKSSGIFIKPSSLTLTRASGSNGKIPNGWTVLNRIDGKLYYAQSGSGYSAGDEYTGEDPYAWYYN